MKRSHLLNAIVATSFALTAGLVHAESAGSISEPSGPTLLESSAPAPVTLAAEQGTGSAAATANGGDPSGPVIRAATDRMATYADMPRMMANVGGHSAGSISDPSGPDAS